MNDLSSGKGVLTVINVLIVDDHPLLGEGTKRLIDSEPDMQAHFALSGEEALLIMQERLFDLYVYDMHLPGINGLELAMQTAVEKPILIYSGFDITSDLKNLLQAGIVGVIEKTASPRQLIRCLRSALEGCSVFPTSLLHQLVSSQFEVEKLSEVSQKVMLTDKECLILEGVMAGRSNKELAEALFISQRTVEYNLTGIFTKLGVHSRAEAALAAKKLGLITH
ncbi:hypothetical protein B9G55_12295 [Saccharibacillus sp. O16]|nr:hypothetical protein B9G55_12295 [Saccharibacillus sp. O16]